MFIRIHNHKRKLKFFIIQKVKAYLNREILLAPPCSKNCLKFLTLGKKRKTLSEFWAPRLSLWVLCKTYTQIFKFND